MKFKDFAYERPDAEKIKKDIKALAEKFENAGSYQEQTEITQEYNKIRNLLDTMATLVQIRHTIDVNDKFYEEEQDYFDEKSPEFTELTTDFTKKMLNSKFRPELENFFGKHLFNMYELDVKTFSPEIIDDLKEENKLVSKYVKLISTAKIPFDGEERTLVQLTPYIMSEDRSVRKDASDAKFGYFSEHLEEFDGIYDSLVKVRDRMAKKLGYKNFVQLGYDKLGRTDYNSEMVKGYRKQIHDFVTPISEKLFERQRKRVNLDNLYFYDEFYAIPGGNPKPTGTTEEKVKLALKMYNELSPETGEFFEFMTENELMDLESKKGKAGGGYCTFIKNYKSPFIFSNFNGTSGDVDVLTHEAGHAFQVYSSRHYEVPEYLWPTMESAEIHSMSMEFLTWPWWNLFYGENTDTAKFLHLSDALNFLPYGVSVDEFQEWVYENPDVSPKERRSKWREIEKKCMPWKNYDGSDYLENGGFWQKQSHIYEVPFYYIDYTLAQVCAFQFWKKSNENRTETWNDYVKLCKLGGTKPFTELVKEANLISPFEDGCLKSVAGFIKNWLDSVSDDKLI